MDHEETQREDELGQDVSMETTLNEETNIDIEANQNHFPTHMDDNEAHVSEINEGSKAHASKDISL